MTQAFLGKDIIENRSEFPDLPEEFFVLVDPEGTNVIYEFQKKDSEYRCKCLCKFTSSAVGFEVYITFTELVWKKIVFEISLESLRQEVH